MWYIERLIIEIIPKYFDRLKLNFFINDSVTVHVIRISHLAGFVFPSNFWKNENICICFDEQHHVSLELLDFFLFASQNVFTVSWVSNNRSVPNDSLSRVLFKSWKKSKKNYSRFSGKHWIEAARCSCSE